jgi:hypothetical protein
VSSTPEAAVRYDRYALILDPERTRLGIEAVGLVDRGIDPLYAADPNEALLLAQQEGHRLGALVVPGSLSMATFDALIAEVAPELWAGAGAIVVVDPPRDRGSLRALCDRGIRWALREPYDAAEFRFVVSAAFATDDKLDPRRGLRVPIHLPARVELPGGPADAMVRNLSVGGAFVALAEPPPPRTEIALELCLGEGELRCRASAVYRQPAGVPNRAIQEAGMGVAFRDVGEGDSKRLAEFVRERVGGFRL